MINLLQGIIIYCSNKLNKYKISAKNSIHFWKTKNTYDMYKYKYKK